MITVNSLSEIIHDLQKRVTKDFIERFQNAIVSGKGFIAPDVATLSKQGDYDFTNASDEDQFSIIDAIRQEVQSPKIKIGQNNRITIEFGHVNTLLSLNSRTLYYEYGTLSSTDPDVSLVIGQSTFSGWKNPNLKIHIGTWKQRFRNSLVSNDGDWCFATRAAIDATGRSPLFSYYGRFGRGYTVYHGASDSFKKHGADITPINSIPPVRMYRGTLQYVLNSLR
jgi:hypothetical protein